MKRLRRHIERVPVKRAARAGGSVALWLALFTLGLVALGVSLGRWWAPHYVATHRAELMAMISETVGVELLSDDLQLIWNRWGPRLQVTGLRIRSEGGETPASLDRAQFSANVYKMMLSRQLIIDDIEVDGLHLDVLRSATGSWQLGLSSASAAAQGRTSNWFAVLDGLRWLNLRDSVITLRDEAGGWSYVLRAVDVVATHSAERYRLSVKGDLPAQLGDSAELILDVNGHSGDALSGWVYLGAERLQVGELARAGGSLGLEGEGQLDRVEVWQQLDHGALSGGQLALSGQSVTLAGGQASDPWRAALLDVSLGWQRDGEAMDAWVNSLVHDAGGEVWDAGPSRVRRDRDGRWQLQGDLLRLENIASLIAQLGDWQPAVDLARWANERRPAGDVINWRAHLLRDAAGRWRPTFDGLLSGLQLSASGHQPGVSGLDALVRLREDHLSARVDSARTRIELPGLLRQPLQLDRLAGVIDVQLPSVARGWSLRSEQVSVRLGEAELAATFEIADPAALPGLAINLQAHASGLQAEQLPALYPAGVMPASLVQWLESAVRGGAVERADLVLRGYSRAFPFRDGDGGELRANLAVRDLDLAFAPDWPALSDTQARIEISASGLSAEGQGLFAGQSMPRLALEIDDFRSGQIRLDGALQSDGEALLDFVRNGPLAAELAPHFADIDVSGPVSLALQPQVSLAPGVASKLRGTARLDGAAVAFNALDLSLSDVQGELAFDERGPRAGQWQAQLFDHDWRASLDRLADGEGVRIRASGRAPPAQWMRRRGMPAAPYVRGETALQAEIVLHPGDQPGRGRATLALRSDLRGLQVRAPTPIGKSAAPRVSLALDGELAIGGQSEWRLRYGSLAQLRWRLDARGELRSLALGSGEPLPTLPSRGARVRVNWERADVARWYDWIDRCCLGGEGDADFYVDVFATVAQGLWYGAPVGPGQLQLISDERDLRGRVASQLADGRFSYAHSEATPAWDIDLARVDLNPLLEAEGDLGGAGPPVDPRSLAPLQLRIEQLDLFDVTLRDLRLESEPTPAGLRLKRLLLSSPDYSGHGRGEWLWGADGAHRSALSLFLHAPDIGRAAAGLGRAGVVTGGRGQMELELAWDGALYSPDIAALSGAISLEMADGRIEALDPGAGRVFALLALQTLPQRLALDFSDLSEGLGYNQVKGEFTLSEGVAHSDMLMLEGPVGAINVAGSVDYVNRTLDQSITVLPNVGGSLPVIGAVVGGPVTAAGVLLADKIFRTIGLDVNRFGRRDFTVTGTFDEPVLAQLEAPPSRGLEGAAHGR